MCAASRMSCLHRLQHFVLCNCSVLILVDLGEDGHDLVFGDLAIMVGVDSVERRMFEAVIGECSTWWPKPRVKREG